MGEKERQIYEFDKKEIERKRTVWHGENPGQEDAELHAHHRVHVWFARKYDLPAESIRSPQNMDILTGDDHRKIDHKGMDEKELWNEWDNLDRPAGRLF